MPTSHPVPYQTLRLLEGPRGRVSCRGGQPIVDINIVPLVIVVGGVPDPDVVLRDESVPSRGVARLIESMEFECLWEFPAIIAELLEFPI